MYLIGNLNNMGVYSCTCMGKDYMVPKCDHEVILLCNICQFWYHLQLYSAPQTSFIS